MREEEIKSGIIKFLEHFGESVKEIEYDGWPMWWFFGDKFRNDKLPFQLAKHSIIANAIINEEKIGSIEKLKKKARIFLFRKFFKYNEKSKIWISYFNRKESLSEKDRENIMFLVHTNAILFESGGKNFRVDRIESVIHEVREDSELQEYTSIVDPISHNSWLKLFRYENLVYSFMTWDIKKKADIESSRLHKRWVRLREQMEFKSDVDEKFFTNFLPALDLFFSKEMLYVIVLYYEAYKKIIKEKKIRLLSVYAPSGLIIGCAIAAAHSSGIKTVHISHGMGSPKKTFDLPNSVYHCVIGEEYKKRLIQRGIKPENISVTGAVYMDDIAKYVKKETREKERKTVLLATQPFIEDGELTLKEWSDYFGRYIKELRSMDHVRITVKTHPQERHINLYKSVIKKLGYENVEISSVQEKNQVYALIKKSDIVISVGPSTLVTESIIIGNPAIVIDLGYIGVEGFILLNNEGIIHLDPKEDISKIVSKIFSNSKVREEVINNQKKIVHEYLHKVDGRAGKRVIGIIKKNI